jgi:hypothetical protein
MGAEIPRCLAEDKVLGALWLYWQSKRGMRAMPRRAEIDPAEIPRLLPYLQIVERNAGRFRYRLAGSAIVEAYGRELTGKFIDEVIPAHRLAIAEHHYSTVYDSGRPIFARNNYVTTKAVDIIATRIILPLSTSGEQASLLLMGQTFELGAQLEARSQLAGDTQIDPHSGIIEYL